MIDRHRTLLHARPATRACPELLFSDVVVQQPILEHSGDRPITLPLRPRIPPLSTIQLWVYELSPISRRQWRQLHEPLPRVDDDLPRTQRLASNVGRTRRR